MTNSPLRRTVPLLLILIALAALLFWFQWQDPASEEAADGAGTPTAVQASPAVATADPELIAAESLAPPGEPIARNDAPVAEAAAASEARFLTVHVVAGADAAPAAGAEVLLWPLGGTPGVAAQERTRYQNSSVDVQLEDWGRKFACNEEGIARVPIDALTWFPVAARRGSLWARVDLTTSELGADANITLTLQPALHLEVLVLDEQRQPAAGIPVGYWSMSRGGISRGEESVTGEDGRARLRHLEYEVTRQAGRTDQHAVGIALPLDPLVLQVFDPEHPPSEPIVLTLPATGVVEVEVRTADGELVAIRTNVALQRLLPDADPESRPGKMSIQVHRGLQQQPTQNGVARFEGVGLGLMLECGVDFESTRVYDRVVGSGPQRPGEVVRFTIQQSTEFPILVGRLVGDRGQPLVETWWQPELLPVESNRRVGRVSAQTDADGRFRASLGAGIASGSHLLLALDSQPGRLALSIVPLALPLAPGVQELGDVVFGGPLFASGVVLDADGSPAAQAFGTIERAREEPRFGRKTEGALDGIQWRVDAEGRFEIRGKFPQDLYRLEAILPGNSRLRCEPIEIRPGTADLVFRFSPQPGVYGRVLLDEGIPADSLLVLLKDASGGRGTSIAEGGEFFLSTMNEIGFLDLVVQLGHGQGVELWRRPGLSFDENTVVDVGEIDLRGRLLGTRLHLLDAAGAPVGRARVYLPTGIGDARSLSHGKFPSVLLTLGPSPCWLEADGCALQEIFLDGREQTVKLSAGIALSVVCEGLPADFDGALQLETFVEAGIESWRSNRRTELPAGSTRAEFALPHAGKWTASLNARSRDGDLIRLPGAFGEQSPFLVPTGAGPHLIRLTVDPEALRASTPPR